MPTTIASRLMVALPMPCKASNATLPQRYIVNIYYHF